MEHHHAIFMGKSTISMAIFNSYVSLPEGKPPFFPVVNTSWPGWIVAVKTSATAKMSRSKKGADGIMGHSG